MMPNCAAHQNPGLSPEQTARKFQRGGRACDGDTTVGGNHPDKDPGINNMDMSLDFAMYPSSLCRLRGLALEFHCPILESKSISSLPHTHELRVSRPTSRLLRQLRSIPGVRLKLVRVNVMVSDSKMIQEPVTYALA
jgi:hypothetical protein